DLQAGGQAERLKTRRNVRQRLKLQRSRRNRGRCSKLVHGVALLRGISTPKPIGSRRATPLLLFQHRTGQFRAGCDTQHNFAFVTLARYSRAGLRAVTSCREAKTQMAGSSPAITTVRLVGRRYRASAPPASNCAGSSCTDSPQPHAEV